MFGLRVFATGLLAAAATIGAASSAGSGSTMYTRIYFEAPTSGLGPIVGESIDECVMAGMPPEPTIVTTTTGTVTPYFMEWVRGACPGGLL